MPPTPSSRTALRHRSRAGLALSRPLRSFSSFPSARQPHRVTKLRRDMFAWLNGPGAALRDPLPGSTNYLSAYDAQGKLIRARGRGKPDEEAEADEEDGGEAELGRGPPEEKNIANAEPLPRERVQDLRPFPGNAAFRSQAVLGEDKRQAIFEDVARRGMSPREASEKHGVDIARVGAVVRLKAVEEEWVAQGKPLATAYARAVLAMLPRGAPGKPHEPINDLPVHAATTPQIFWPTSESRAFTRADAGAVFQKGLLPADRRIPHPQMVRANNAGEPGLPTNAAQRAEALRKEMREEDAKSEEKATRGERTRRENTTAVQGGRWEFRFEDVRVDERSTGRFARGVGQRYGVPMQDRKKGQVKIPTRVE